MAGAFIHSRSDGYSLKGNSQASHFEESASPIDLIASTLALLTGALLIIASLPVLIIAIPAEMLFKNKPRIHGNIAAALVCLVLIDAAGLIIAAACCLSW